MNGRGVADLHLFITTYVERRSARQWPQQTTSAAANKHRRIVSLSLVRRLLRPKFSNYYYSIWVKKNCNFGVSAFRQVVQKHWLGEVAK